MTTPDDGRTAGNELSPVETMIFRDEGTPPRFAVGLHLYFDILQQSKRLRVRTSLVGWYKPHVLMTTTPLIDERALVLSTGSEMVVRYLFEGQIFGFITRLLRKMNDPAPMWFLEYPGIVEVKNLRNSTRMQTLLPVKVNNDSEALILDCSATGALIAVNLDQQIGEHVKLAFKLPDGAEITDLDAVVVRTQATVVDRMVGVVFDPSDVVKTAPIQRYIDRFVSHQRAVTPEFELDES